MLELKSPALAAHSRAVAGYARQLGAALDLPAETCETLFLAGLLHDIGKIGLPGELLDKGGLSPEEQGVYGLHPTLAVTMLNRLSGFKAVRDAVMHHHERVDGRGYPEGLAGDKIPLNARVLAVCNAFDRLVRGSPGRPPIAPALAREALRRGAGTHFDPDITQQFLELEPLVLELQPQYS
jgi:HD-GYP domain-containing protein (c-di-GMP phosphodiesterase class II)